MWSLISAITRQQGRKIAQTNVSTRLLIVEDFDEKRIDLCIPDGSRDMPFDKAIILENRMDELNAIDWNKGCYLGQELMARTKQRGLIRKELMTVNFEGLPPENNEILLFEGTKVGAMRTSCKNKGLAFIFCT